MPRQYRYFSADNHFESLPETWTHRVLAKYHVIDGLPADLSPRPKSLALVNEQFAGVPEEERSAILAKTQSVLSPRSRMSPHE
jgi:hypothetical protein